MAWHKFGNNWPHHVMIIESLLITGLHSSDLLRRGFFNVGSHSGCFVARGRVTVIWDLTDTHTQTHTQTQTQAHHSQGQAHTRGIVCWSSNISAPIYIWAQSPFIFWQFLVIWSEISVIISRRIHNKADASLKGKGSIEPVWSERRTKASQTAVVVVTIHWIGKLRQLVDLKVNQLTSSLSSWSSSSSSSWSRPVWSWGCGRRRRTWGCWPAGAPTREQKEKIKQRHQNRTTRKWNNEHITQSLWKLLWFFLLQKRKTVKAKKWVFFTSTWPRMSQIIVGERWMKAILGRNVNEEKRTWLV